MTIKECIDKVDNLKPNQYSLEDKVDWLSFIEMTIINDVLKTHEGYDGRYDNFKGYSADRTDVELIVPSPYDRLYTAFLTMKIDESNGETARYNNSAILYNSYMGEYRKYYNKTHMPIDVTKKASANVINNSINLTDAMYANLVKDLTHILTQYFGGAVSPDKIYDIVMSYMQNNAELFKGKDGKTPIKGQDYFTDADIKEIMDDLTEFAKDEVQSMSRDFEDDLLTIKTIANQAFREVKNGLPKKVDKVDGMGLSEENYTANDKTLLYRINNQIKALDQNMAYKVDAVPGKTLSSNDYTSEDKALLYETKMQMSGKVDKEFGKGLSTEDYTTEEKEKLSNLDNRVKDIEEKEHITEHLTDFFKEIPDGLSIDDLDGYKYIGCYLVEETQNVYGLDCDVKYLLFVNTGVFANNEEQRDEGHIFQTRYYFDAHNGIVKIQTRMDMYNEAAGLWEDWQDVFATPQYVNEQIAKIPTGGGGSDDKLFTYEPQLEITAEEAVNTITINEIGGISLSDYNYTAIKCVVENAVLETAGPNAQVTVYVNSKAYDKYQTPLGSPTTFINANKKLYWGCYADIKSGLMLSASSSVSNETWTSTVYMPINSQNLHRKDKIEYLNISIVMGQTFPIGTKFRLWFK